MIGLYQGHVIGPVIRLVYFGLFVQWFCRSRDVRLSWLCLQWLARSGDHACHLVKSENRFKNEWLSSFLHERLEQPSKTPETAVQDQSRNRILIWDGCGLGACS